MPSPLKFLRAGPPPPKVVLLPGALFFVRSVPVAMDATPAEVATQVELALEAVSPFPLAQLYYGWFPVPAAGRAVVFASYRRRFTADQLEAWGDAELVLPAFAATFATRLDPATTVVLNEPEGLTAIHWDENSLPGQVLVRPLAVDAGDEERARVRDELLAAVGGGKPVVDLPEPLVPDAGKSDRELVFRAGDFVARLPAGVAAALDVRDKGELATRRSSRRRDLVFWRVALGCAASLLLLAVGEFALVGGRAWQTMHTAKLTAQKPVVDRIMTSQELANRIEDLATRQLVPLEMLTELVGPNLERKPPDIQFTRIQADKSRGLYTVVIDAQTANAAQMSVYQGVLEKLPSMEKLEFLPQPSRGQFATFRIIFTFKPGALKPTTS
jgi:hypothetical protein